VKHGGTGLRQILALALPVIAAELGWMFMGVVDTIMVGPLGPAAIAAVSIGNAGYEVFALTGIGLLLGLDTLVSQSFGAQETKECNRWLWQALYLAAVISGPMMLAMSVVPAVLRGARVNASVVSLAAPYLHALTWSLPPLLIYAACRRYLQGMSVVRPVMFALISANVVNAVGNRLLIGPYGVAGVGWSTCIARVYMAAALACVAILREPDLLRRIPRPDPQRVWRLLQLGAPAAGQLLLEIGVFATATVLAGRLSAQALAAHHIAINIAATTFMVPLGVSSAAAVAVGQAIGRGDPAGARRAGWLSLALGAGFMFTAAIVLLTAPAALIGIFTRNSGILEIAVPLMFVAALFQTFDGIQVVATGVLRGAGNTRTPMLANLLAHWLLGLPAGYLLCFTFGLGVTGLWIGLSIGLIAVATLLLAAWWRIQLRPRPRV
jgi:multidrug resistance protein, MATE family